MHLLGIDYRVSSVIAFLVSVLNNFWLNRHWTFSARAAHPMLQALRFFTISVVASASPTWCWLPSWTRASAK